MANHKEHHFELGKQENRKGYTLNTVTSSCFPVFLIKFLETQTKYVIPKKIIQAGDRVCNG